MGTSPEHGKNPWDELILGIKQAGLSRRKFAEWCNGELNEPEEEEKIFWERFKKQLKRKSVTEDMAATVESYLQVLYRHPDYIARVGRIAPRKVEYPEIDSETQNEFKRISSLLDEKLPGDLDGSDD